jgi:peptide/nickel transport system substrate-binding protein
VTSAAACPNSIALTEHESQNEQATSSSGKFAASSLYTRRRLFGSATAAASAFAGLTVAMPSTRRVSAYAPRRESLPLRAGDTKTLTIATHRTPSDLDPRSAYDAGSRIVLQGVFETLIRVEPGTTDRYQPAIAESWEPNADQSVWTFHLRDGVRFHDGSSCDAEAVRTSFARLLALNYGPSTVVGRFVQDASSISSPDAKTVVFDLGRPAPLFEAAISSATVSAIVNAKLAKTHEVDGDWGHAWAQAATDGLGTGPFRVTRFDLEDGILFEQNDDYWRGWDGAHFTQVIERIVPEASTRRELVERGDIDIVDSLSPETIDDLAANPDLVVDLRYNLAVHYIMFNESGPLQSAAARQAICFAFPYDDVIKGVYDGHAKRAIGPCPELLRGFSADTYVYETDLDRARQMLGDAGVPENTTLSIVIPVGVPLADTIAQLFAANLAEIGLKLDVQRVDFPTFVSIYYGDLPAEERPNLMPAFWSPDYNDGWNDLWPQLSSKAWKSGNAGHYANDRVDMLLDEARDASKEASYYGALAEIQQIVTRDDPAAIYYSQEQWPTILRKSVGGFQPNLVSSELYDFYELFRQPE